MPEISQPSAYKSISFRLALIISICAALILCLSEITEYQNIKTRILNEIHAVQLSDATNMADNIHQKLKTRKEYVASLTELLAKQKDTKPASLQHTLKETLPLYSRLIKGAVIIKPDGSGLITQHPVIPARSKLTFDTTTWFHKALSQPTPVISRPFSAVDTHEPVIAIANTIRKPDGTALGILAAPLLLKDPDFLGPLYDKNYRQHGDFLLVSRSQKFFIAASDAELAFKPTPPPGTNPQHDRNMQGFNGIAFATSKHGVEYISAIVDVPGTDWFLVARDRKNDALAPLQEQFKDAALKGIFLIVAVFVLTFLTAYLFLRPLRRTARDVRSMGQNNNPLDLLPSDESTEIGDLVKGINTLISTVKAQQTTLEALSRTDALTQISNRHAFNEVLDQRWRSHMRSLTSMSVILIDIDYFKRFNDTYGHLDGDKCLADVAQALNKRMQRPDDFVARYGGEEFAVILSQDSQNACKFGNILRQAIADMNILHTGSPHGTVTISLGVASMIPSRDASSDDLIQAADEALYLSKDQGRNCVNCTN